MSIKVNPIMLRAGYATAKDVAEVINKSLNTVHRLVASGDFVGTVEGRVLYILVDSIVKFYADNIPMRVAVQALRPAKKKTGT